MNPTLQFGDSGPDVARVQNILKKEGHFKGACKGNFKILTDAAVKYFQSTHIGQDGDFLEADGVVGPKTWWALLHPHGDTQRNYIDPIIPRGLTPMRQAVLEAACAEHRAGVREIPNGSNWGDGVIKYGGRPGWAWCCGYTTYCWRKGKVIRFKEFSTYSMWQWAKKEGLFVPLAEDGYFDSPVFPGDALLFQHKKPSGAWTRTGHITLVARISRNGKTFNTIGGNEGNRVKFGVRTTKAKDLVGFIRLPEYEIQLIEKVEKGIIKASDVSKDSTR